MGPYQDTIVCEVLPMSAWHVLLGWPWQFDRDVTHRGRANEYELKHNGKKVTLKPMTAEDVVAMKTRARERAKLDVLASEKKVEQALESEGMVCDFVAKENPKMEQIAQEESPVADLHVEFQIVAPTYVSLGYHNFYKPGFAFKDFQEIRSESFKDQGGLFVFDLLGRFKILISFTLWDPWTDYIRYLENHHKHVMRKRGDGEFHHIDRVHHPIGYDDDGRILYPPKYNNWGIAEWKVIEKGWNQVAFEPGNDSKKDKVVIRDFRNIKDGRQKNNFWGYCDNSKKEEGKVKGLINKTQRVGEFKQQWITKAKTEKKVRVTMRAARLAQCLGFIKGWGGPKKWSIVSIRIPSNLPIGVATKPIEAWKDNPSELRTIPFKGGGNDAIRDTPNPESTNPRTSKAELKSKSILTRDHAWESHILANKGSKLDDGRKGDFTKTMHQKRNNPNDWATECMIGGIVKLEHGKDGMWAEMKLNVFGCDKGSFLGEIDPWIKVDRLCNKKGKFRNYGDGWMDRRRPNEDYAPSF